jgi:hypothetical protein
MSNEIEGHQAVIEADPKRPWKTYAATAVAFLGSLALAWVQDVDPYTGKEFVEDLVSSVLFAGATGGVTFMVKNPLRSRRL